MGEANVRRQGAGSPEPAHAVNRRESSRSRRTPPPSPRDAAPTAAYPRPIAAASGKRSWIGCTPNCSVRSASMARTQASAAGSVVMQGTP